MTALVSDPQVAPAAGTHDAVVDDERRLQVLGLGCEVALRLLRLGDLEFAQELGAVQLLVRPPPSARIR